MGLFNTSHGNKQFKAPDKGVFCIAKNDNPLDKKLFLFSDSPSDSIFIHVKIAEVSNIKRYIYFESERSDQSIAKKIITDTSGFKQLYFEYVADDSLTQQINDILYNVSLLKQYFKYMFILVDPSDGNHIHIFSKASKCTVFYNLHNTDVEEYKKYVNSNALRYFDLNTSLEVSPESTSRLINKSVYKATSRSSVAIIQVAITVVVYMLLIFFSQYMSSFTRSLQSFSEINVEDTEYQYQYEFSGNEKIYRISRYLISKHVSWIADSADIKEYLQMTIDRSNIYTDSLLTYVPRKGTIINFYDFPDSLVSPKKDSLKKAYEFYTSIYGDSIAYLTDHWQKSKSKEHRKHRAIDIGTSFDTYIFAPIDGHAYVRESERGGKMISLFNDDFVITFAHCNKLLFFDNQDAYKGDVLATVGLSGNTSGPHAHIETGIRSSKGNVRYGNKRYKLIDPFKWYYIYSEHKAKEAKKNALKKNRLDSIAIDSTIRDSIHNAERALKRNVEKRKRSPLESQRNRSLNSFKYPDKNSQNIPRGR